MVTDTAEHGYCHKCGRPLSEEIYETRYDTTTGERIRDLVYYACPRWKLFPSHGCCRAHPPTTVCG